jgi:hypothetical protein
MTDEEAAELRGVVGGDCDWAGIVERSRYHRVFPLLYANLKKHLPERVPADILERLKGQVVQNGMRNLSLLGRLIAVVALLRQNGVEALAFKGPILAETVYGNIGLRTFGDLDLLISRHDLAKVISLLLTQGFRLDIDLSEAQYHKLAERNHHAVMIKDGVPVELHWELSGRYFHKNVYLEALHGRAEEVDLSGHRMMTLGGEDLLIYLCLHGCRHHWEQLDAVCCVAELVKKRADFDWDVAWRLAREMGAEKMVVLGLMLAERMLGLRLPEEVRGRLAGHPGLAKMAGEVAGAMTARDGAASGRMSYWQFCAFHYRIMDRHWDWVLYCSKPLWNPTHSDWLFLKLPAPLAGLYFVLRPLRLLRKYMGLGSGKGSGLNS